MVAGPLFQCNAGVKQLYRQLISLFQSMPEHFCAQASSTRNSRRRFLVDIRGCLCSGTDIRSEKILHRHYFSLFCQFDAYIIGSFQDRDLT
jgi:hypothetical protein